MKRTEEVPKSVVEEEENYYCDDCGEHLGTVDDFDGNFVGYNPTIIELDENKEVISPLEVTTTEEMYGIYARCLAYDDYEHFCDVCMAERGATPKEVDGKQYVDATNRDIRVDDSGSEYAGFFAFLGFALIVSSITVTPFSMTLAVLITSGVTFLIVAGVLHYE